MARCNYSSNRQFSRFILFKINSSTIDNNGWGAGELDFNGLTLLDIGAEQYFGLDCADSWITAAHAVGDKSVDINT